MTDIQYDIVIIGGSLGGVSAALSAAKSAPQLQICLLEATGWLGGQYTAQGVTRPDENRYTDTVGSTLSYRMFKHNVRAFYRNNYKLSVTGAAQPQFDPGGPYPGFSMEPLVGHQVLLHELSTLSNVHVYLNATVTAVEMNGDAISAISTTDTSNVASRFTGAYFLDATDLGDLLPLCGTEGADWVIGAESQADTGEPGAPTEAHPEWIQPITLPVAVEHRPVGEDHTIARPAEYDQLKAEQNYTIQDGYISKMFTAGKDMWSYRSIIAAANFADPRMRYDVTMLNMAANDYMAATIPTGDPVQDAAIVERAREASLGFVYWLQTECPRDENPAKLGYPELKLRTDLFNTPDGTAAQPYIREPRRIKAQKRIVQQEIGDGGPRAALFKDSCGIGDYGGMDVHGCTGNGCQQMFATALPFQIPLGALIPVRLTNLLPACKNIGTTHITNGVYRLHPAEWNIGEAAGALAALCINSSVTPASVPTTPDLLKQFQHALLDAGVPLYWWTDVTTDMPEFKAVQLLGVNGYASGYEDMSFRPGVLLSDPDKQALNSSTGAQLPWPSGSLTRGQAAQWLVQQLNL